MGITVFFGGQWIDRVGPRVAGLVAGSLWGSGLAITAAGAAMHSLPLLYLGYGVFGGLGFGLGLMSPTANMVKWFPDKKGLATGLCLCGFGGGAMVATPTIELLTAHFSKPAQVVGNVGDLSIVTEQGVRMAEVAGQMQEVVVSNDVAYLVGTGATGCWQAFAGLSAMYTVAMMSGAWLQRSPPPGYAPAGFVAQQNDSDWYVPKEKILSGAYSVGNKTVPQFPLMWAGVYGYSIAGVSVLSCAKTMITDVYGGALPLVVTGTFAASFVAGLSVINTIGRIGWAGGSDIIGRKTTMLAFGILGTPAALSMPYLAHWVSAEPSTTPLYLFCGVTGLMITTYGGLLAVIPAYGADMFGTPNTSNVYGKLMTGWATAAMSGPIILTQLRTMSYNAACDDLSKLCDPEAFHAKFGGHVEELSLLIEQKTVTIDSLMELAPAGTVDPTPFLYDSTMQLMGGVYFTALACNVLVNKVDPALIVYPQSEELAEATKEK